MYQNMIREELARQGSIGTDPALVEAWMRAECGTLDGLSGADFSREVRVAAECVAADPVASRSLAASLALV